MAENSTSPDPPLDLTHLVIDITDYLNKIQVPNQIAHPGDPYHHSLIIFLKINCFKLVQSRQRKR